MSTANSLQSIEYQLKQAIELCNDHLKNTLMSYENVEIELSDKEFLHLAKLAHEQDITFNQMVNKILFEYMEKETKNDESRSST